jgi:hypothetical protein
VGVGIELVVVLGFSEGSLPGRDVAPGSDQPRGEEAPQIVVEARSARRRRGTVALTEETGRYRWQKQDT